MVNSEILYKVTEINDDGSLKPIFDYKTKFDLKIGSTIAYLTFDENGKPLKRNYYKIHNITYCIGIVDKQKDVLYDLLNPTIEVILELSEDISNEWV